MHSILAIEFRRFEPICKQTYVGGFRTVRTVCSAAVHKESREGTSGDSPGNFESIGLLNYSEYSEVEE